MPRLGGVDHFLFDQGVYLWPEKVADTCGYCGERSENHERCGPATSAAGNHQATMPVLLRHAQRRDVGASSRRAMAKHDYCEKPSAGVPVLPVSTGAPRPYAVP